ncbi:transposase domain-containing protein [Gilvimarinus sp. 2_MG-2023]|nr:transposase domain-containing protein [Gilvimarinus sp. 2_MG-2023]MDO6572345.1 transposase domain-containing protein [Gilvimarinus sp. 2_MG-2023]
METAKARDLEPYAYPKHVFTELFLTKAVEVTYQECG